MLLSNESNMLVITDDEHIDIRNLIYTIRGKQVMLDSDVARLYKYETKNINKAMKRNIDRFPEDFCFQLTEEEMKNLRFQNGTSSIGNEQHGGRRYLHYVYTEQGISMLAGVLKNEIAIQVSINIMRAFAELRKFIAINGQVFERLTNVEYKLLEHDSKFKQVFDILQKDKENEFKQKIFYKGQIWDSYELIIDIIKTAKQKIVLIDNYIDESILRMLEKKNKNVEVVILTSQSCKITALDIKKFNQQYPILKLAKTDKFHDRFIVIDNKELYHCGASIKDLGKKCFGINKIEDKNMIGNLIKNLY